MINWQPADHNKLWSEFNIRLGLGLVLVLELVFGQGQSRSGICKCYMRIRNLHPVAQRISGKKQYNNTRKGTNQRTKKRKIKEKEPIRECILEILMTPSSGKHFTVATFREAHFKIFRSRKCGVINLQAYTQV